jgi:hypothetical protein
MNARTLRWSALLVALVLVAGGSGLALEQAQNQPAPASAPRTLADVASKIDDLYKRVEAVLYAEDVLDAWIRLAEAREAELNAGRRVAVVGDNRTVFMDRAAFNQSLLRHVTQSIIDEAASEKGDPRALGLAADADLLKEMVRALERVALAKSEEYLRALAADIADQIARKYDLMGRRYELLGEIGELVALEARLERAEANWGGVPRPARTSARNSFDLGSSKEFLGRDLDELRKAQNWSADHHMQVGTLIGVARTMEELYAAARLVVDYGRCYDTKNLRRAAVLANARTGMYKTPGERIAALDEIAFDFNTCTGKAAADFSEARGRLSNPGK